MRVPRMISRLSVWARLGLLLLTGCLPGQIKDKVTDINSLTTQVQKEDVRLCTAPAAAPAPSPPPVMPPICTQIVDYALHLREANRACKAVEDQLDKTGHADAADCEAKHREVVAIGATLGFKPVKPSKQATSPPAPSPAAAAPAPPAAPTAPGGAS